MGNKQMNYDIEEIKSYSDFSYIFKSYTNISKQKEIKLEPYYQDNLVKRLIMNIERLSNKDQISIIFSQYELYWLKDNICEYLPFEYKILPDRIIIWKNKNKS